MKEQPSRITLRAFCLGAVCAGIFTLIAIWTANRGSQVTITATQIPVLSYVLLFAMVLLLNPLCRLIRIVRPFSMAEILIVLIMGLVSGGIPIFGLTMQLLPLTGSLYYRDWNTDQSQWDRYVQPHLNDQFFVGEAGTQAAARKYKDAAERREQLKLILDSANALEVKQEALSALLGQNPASDPASVQEAAARVREARLGWELVAQKYQAPPQVEVVRSYPVWIEAQELELSAAKAELTALNQKAFEKVELFRRGLPREQQAFPGILWMPNDDASSYTNRLSRLWHGRAAFNEVAALAQTLAGQAPDMPLDAAFCQTARTRLDAAAARLQPLSAVAALQKDLEEMNAELSRVTATLAQTESKLDEANSKKRFCAPEEERDLVRQISALERQSSALAENKTRLNIKLEAKNRECSIQQLIGTVLTDIAAVREQLLQEPEAHTAGALRAKLNAVLHQFPAFDASYQRYFVGDVPWSHWLGPLARWGILILLTYIVLMTFNVLIFRQWNHNEKLIYPLAEFSEVLVGQKDDRPGGIPEVFRSGLFWAGLAVSCSILGWNLLSHTQLVPGLGEIDLRGRWEPYIADTWLKGLLPDARSAVFFTMIGLAFLSPARVTFSLWFFSVICMLQLLLLVWLGYGENSSSFPSEWQSTMNFGSAQGGGALLVFASVVMYKCRQYLLSAFRPGCLKGLQPDEQRELRISSALFLGCSVSLIMYLWLGMGANIWYTIIVFGGIMMLTIGLVRAVAEGGLLAFQAHAGPFHFIRNIVGFDKTWSSPALFAPLMMYYSVLFLDIKTFIAPAMATSLKLREDLRMERGRFHLAVFAAIGLAVVISVVASLIMAYSEGANAMNTWFYTGFPNQACLAHLKTNTQNPPGASDSNLMWILGGASAMAALLYFRQLLFWLPHPIGLIMLVNPMMGWYWFPILLGWAAKTAVTRYGNRDTYVRARTFFIGLIVGELLIVVLALYVSYLLNVRIPIDLNRSG